MSLDYRKILLHFVVPMAVMTALIAMTYSGVYILEMIMVMPHLDTIAPASRRELGLVENLQNVLILATLVVAARAALRAQTSSVRAIFAAAAAGSLFMLLEEMDYGLHYYEWLTGTPPEEAAEVRNLHNQGISSPLKSISNVLLIGGFVVAPLALRRVRSPWIQYLLPSPYFLLTMLCALITSRIGHAFEPLAERIGFGNNIGEFRETVTYYIALLYVVYLSLRTLPTPGTGQPMSDAESPTVSRESQRAGV